MKNKLIIGLPILFILAVIIVQVVGLRINYLNVKKLRGEVKDIRNSIMEESLKNQRTIFDKIGSLEEDTHDVLKILLANKVDNICKDAKNDHDRCVAIAKWVSSNISARNDTDKGVLNWFANRWGLCSARSNLFVEMCRILNIPAHVYNIYDLGGNFLNNHSCAQAWYSGKWHFFDVTYAGMFLDSKGVVMSWEEIKESPDTAVKGMVIFKDNIDSNIKVEEEYKNYEGFKRADRASAMKACYSPENINKASCYGFRNSNKQKVLKVGMDLSKGLQFFDKNNGKPRSNLGQLQPLTNDYMFSLGNKHDNFLVEYSFSGCEPGRKYRLKYKFSSVDPDPTEPPATLTATSTGARILNGGPHVFSGGDLPRRWTVEFQAESDKCVLLITPGGNEDFLLFADRVEIAPAN